MRRSNACCKTLLQSGVREILTLEDANAAKLEAIYGFLVDSRVRPATASPDIRRTKSNDGRLVSRIAAQGRDGLNGD